MPIVANEIKQQTCIAMAHDITNIINRLSSTKMNLLNSMTNLLNTAAMLDPDSPEFKQIEARKNMLAAYEKKLDMEIQQYQNRLKTIEAMQDNTKQAVDKGIQKFYTG